MKSAPAINPALNLVLKHELTIINQTFLHARMHQNWGLEGLGERVYGLSIIAMKEADRLIKRILLLEGLPNLQDIGRLGIGETPAETLTSDHLLYQGLRGALAEGIATCEGAADFQSRDHLERLLHQTEEAIDWYETQEGLIASMGLENYIQSQLSDDKD